MEFDASDGVWIGGGSLRARILGFGATLQDLRLDPFANPLVLSLDAADYEGAHKSLYAGAIVGRVAGRIANGCAPLGDAILDLLANEGPHHLHGGMDSFAHQTWIFEEVSQQAATLSLRSPAQVGGYPGTVEVTARYEVHEDAVLSLALEAKSDAPTLLNLCHHPYFNLDGSETIEGHTLRSPARFYLPSDGAAVPTGEIADVLGTAFDFTLPRGLGMRAYDHSLCLHHAASGPLAFAARLQGQGRGPALEIWTTQPALHVFDGRSTAGVRAADGRVLSARAGVALEAQGWPDAPNNSQFPAITLNPQTLYRQVTEYRFIT